MKTRDLIKKKKNEDSLEELFKKYDEYVKLNEKWDEKSIDPYWQTPSTEKKTTWTITTTTDSTTVIPNSYSNNSTLY